MDISKVKKLLLITFLQPLTVIIYDAFSEDTVKEHGKEQKQYSHCPAALILTSIISELKIRK